MVTAELAVAIPALVSVLALALTGISLGISQVVVVDAARIGARAAARGESVEQVVATVHQTAPSAGVVVTTEGEWVRVTVRLSAPQLMFRLGLPAPQSTAVAVIEDAGSGP